MLGFIEAECILMRLDLERHGTWHTATTRSFPQSVGGNLINLSLFLSNYLLVFTGTCVCPRSLGAIAYHFPYCFEVIWCKRNAASVHLSFSFESISGIRLYNLLDCYQDWFFSNICCYHSFCLLSAFFGYFANAKQQRNDSFFWVIFTHFSHIYCVFYRFYRHKQLK